MGAAGCVPALWCRNRALAGFAALVLAGCVTVGTDYSPPQVEAPAQWTAAADERPPDPAVLAEWWRQFDDPLLDTLVADALDANLDLATARAQLREARGRRALAGAQLGPAVAVSASGSRTGLSGETGSGATVELYRAGFDASWEPDIFGRLRRGVEASQADLDASGESLRDTRVSLVAEVVLNYVDLRTAERRLAVAESTVVARGETWDLTRWRFQAGLVSELDVAQAKTDLESASAVLPALRTTVVEAQNRLAVLLGRPAGALKERLAPTATVPLAVRGVTAGIPADTLRQRPDVRAAERRLAAQTARLAQAEADRYPVFSLAGFLGREGLTLGALGNGSAAAWSLLGAVAAPVFDSGRIGANIEVQDALVEQAWIAYQAAVLVALQDVENALVAVANAGERLARLEQATQSARQTMLIAEQRYASGLTDFLTVLDAQRTLLSLEEQLVGGTGALATAQIQLYKALGGGWSSGPGPVSTEESS